MTYVGLQRTYTVRMKPSQFRPVTVKTGPGRNWKRIEPRQFDPYTHARPAAAIDLQPRHCAAIATACQQMDARFYAYPTKIAVRITRHGRGWIGLTVQQLEDLDRLLTTASTANVLAGAHAHHRQGLQQAQCIVAAAIAQLPPDYRPDR